MSKQFVLLLNDSEYSRLRHLMEQDELKRERTRAYHKSKTGNDCHVYVKPLNPTLLSVVEAPKDSEALILLKKLSEIAPPVAIS